MKKKGFTSMQARFIVIIIIVALISAVGSTAFSIVHSIQGNREQLAGEMTEEEAKKSAADLVRVLSRYAPA